VDAKSARNAVTSKSFGDVLSGTIILSPGCAETYILLKRDIRLIFPFARCI